MKIYPFKLPITSFEHESGVPVQIPVSMSQAVRLQISPQRMASLLKNRLENDLNRKGEYQELLRLFPQCEWTYQRIAIELEKSPDHLYEELTLYFDTWWAQPENKPMLGVVPVLGLMAAGEDIDSLETFLQETIKLELIRKRRLKSLPDLMATQWYREPTLHEQEIDLPFFTLSEIEALKEEKEKKLLDRVARQIEVTDPQVYGMDEVYDQLRNSLRGRQRSSVVLVAGTGQGKTAMIHKLVREIPSWRSTLGTVWEVTAGQLLHRLTDSGGWEAQLGHVCKELRDTGDLLYVPNLLELFEVGQYAGNDRSIADYLRPYIAQGEILLLTECTPEAANEIELRSPGFLALFARVDLPTLSQADLQDVVRRKVHHQAEAKGRLVSEPAVEETLRLHQWFTPYAGLPGKTIKFWEALMAESETEDVLDLPEVYEKFCQESGMPTFLIDPRAPMDLDSTTRYFEQNIYGQSEAIHTVVDVLIAMKTAVIRRGKPLASLLFAGPTGVGKTEMAKVLAKFLFGTRDRMIRFDMSEYRDLPALMRLTGDDGRGEGLLTAAVRQQPFSVVLFDELEKVHPLFYDMLLQILGEGRLTSSTGRVADFSSTLIIMTSNIGATDFQAGGIGFQASDDLVQDAMTHFRSAVQAHFRPELFNRLDRIIAFAPLSREVLRQIVNRELALLQQREGIRGRPITLEIGDETADWLGQKGYHPIYGARFLQRFLRRALIQPLCEELNEYVPSEALALQVTVKGDELHIENTRLRKLPRAETRLSDSKGRAQQTLMELAEEVCALRREMTQMRNGSRYVAFLNRLDGLHTDLIRLRKKGRETRFWKDHANARWYEQAIELRDWEGRLSEALLGLEQDMMLILSALADDTSTLLGRWEKWLPEQEDFAFSLIRLLEPTWNKCSMLIYGTNHRLREMQRIYQKALDKVEVTVEVSVFWYDEGLFQKRQVAIRQAREKGDQEAEWKAEEMPIYRIEPLEGDRYEAKVCGLMLSCKGDLIYPYLAQQAGAQLWGEVDQKKGEKKLGDMMEVNVVIGQATVQHIPVGVHRKEYYQHKRPQRIYSLDTPTLMQDRRHQPLGAWLPVNHLGSWLSTARRDMIWQSLLG